MQYVCRFISWIAKTIANDYLEDYLIEPLRDLSIRFSIRTGVFVIDAPNVSLRVHHEYNTLLQRVAISIPCYALRSESIVVDVQRADIYRKRANICRNGNLLANARRDSTRERTIEQANENETEVNEETNEGANIERNNREQKKNTSSRHGMLLDFIQNTAISVNCMCFEYDATKTVQIHNVLRVARSPSISAKRVLLRLRSDTGSNSEQTVLAEPGCVLYVDVVEKTVLLDIIGSAQLSLDENSLERLLATDNSKKEDTRQENMLASDNSEKPNVETKTSSEKNSKEENVETKTTCGKTNKNPWCRVKMRETAQISLCESQEHESRASCTLLTFKGVEFDGKQWISKQIALQFGSRLCVVANGISESRVARFILKLDDCVIASIANVVIQQRDNAYFIVDTSRSLLIGKSNAVQLQTLFSLFSSFFVHFSVLFPLRLPFSDEGTVRDIEEDILLDDDVKFVENTVLFRFEIANLGVSWTLEEERQNEKQEEQEKKDENDNIVISATVCSAMYTQFALPSTREQCKTFLKQSDFRCAIARWIVHDNVRRSHWKTLISCENGEKNGTTDTFKEEKGATTEAASTLEQNSTTFDLIQYVRFYPFPSKTRCHVRFRTCPVAIALYESTIDFLARFFAWNSGECTEKTAKEAEEANRANLVFDRIELDQVEISIDYKPRNDKKTLQKVFQDANFVYLLQRVPLENTRIMMPRAALRNRRSDSLFNALLAHYVSNFDELASAGVQGVQPIHIALSLGSSVFDLIRIPAQEFARGNNEIAVQALHDKARTVTVELLRTSARVSITSAKLLRAADSALQSRDERARRRAQNQKKPQKSMYADQPATLAAGARASLKQLGRGVVGSAKAIGREPVRAYRRGGVKSMLLATARGIPRALLLQPAIGVTSALAKLAQSATNTIDPQQKVRADNKYK